MPVWLANHCNTIAPGKPRPPWGDELRSRTVCVPSGDTYGCFPRVGTIAWYRTQSLAQHHLRVVRVQNRARGRPCACEGWSPRCVAISLVIGNRRRSRPCMLRLPPCGLSVVEGFGNVHEVLRDDAMLRRDRRTTSSIALHAPITLEAQFQ